MDIHDFSVTEVNR
ncbi:DUF2525 domain-containing protein [Salmonella enterica]|nr:DUF2525 domain-containing protein [Salmonella enterica subsp. enterica serovar Mississippi]MKT41757.1 DUF2525 domain-containing protein [Salmonella enterica]